MRKVTNYPTVHDTFRIGSFFATEVPGKNTSDLTFSHIRDESLCKITIFGSVSP